MKFKYQVLQNNMRFYVNAANLTCFYDKDVCYTCECVHERRYLFFRVDKPNYYSINTT